MSDTGFEGCRLLISCFVGHVNIAMSMLGVVIDPSSDGDNTFC